MRTYEISALWTKLEKLDLEPIKFKLANEKGYSRAELAALEKWYKRFLFLTFTYKSQPIVVSEAIDEFWHQHILDTRKYAEDCAVVFGEFLHHFPYFGLRGEQDEAALRAAYQSSLRLLHDEFGEAPDEELPAFGTSFCDPSLPSLCSDCANLWESELAPLGRERPRLSVV